MSGSTIDDPEVRSIVADELRRLLDVAHPSAIALVIAVTERERELRD